MGRADEGLKLLRDASTSEIRDAHVSQQVTLALIHGLALTGNFAECRDRALRFVTEAYQHSPILYGRGLLWLGMAQHALGEATAQQTLQQALQHENDFGGRDLWLCYYTLGTTSDSSQHASEYYAKATTILRQRAESLFAHPELQITLLNNSFVQSVFTSSQE
jgi:hypothetical protein